MSRERFDFYCDEHGAKIDYHFCREWDESGGCYGTNPSHGLSLDDARVQMAEWHESQAKLWREGSHPDLLRFFIPSKEKDHG